MSKKIAIVLNSAWGAYNTRLNLARGLKAVGNEVCFVIPYNAKYSELIRQEFKVYDFFLDTNSMNPIKDIKTLFELYRIYRKIKPCVVLNFTIKPNIYSSFVASFLHIKSISNITGLGTIFIQNNFVTKIGKILYKISLNRNYKVFFQNNDDRQLFVKNNLIQVNKTDLLPGSGVDLRKFTPQKITQKNQKFIFLMVSRLLKDKGIFELLEATKILKQKYSNFEIHLLGEVGSRNTTAIGKDELQEWVDQQLVVYLGTTDHVQDVIRHVDCVVLPSYREGTPRSLLEASAMEKPIITTNAIGCKEVVSDGKNGYICSARDAKDLALKMEKMLNTTEDELRMMGQYGRKKMEKEFDEKIVIEKYCEAILGC